MKVLTRMRKAVSGWLEKLAESNQKQFGAERPDCCQINRVLPKAKAGRQQ